MNKLPLIFFLVLSFLQIDCKKDPVASTPDEKPDTTSHNFTFTSYTFGGSGGSSYFKDVAIINDSDIWAVGGIFTSPTTSYNAAHWDGKKWELKQIKVALNGNMIMPYLEGAFTFSATDIWFIGSFPIHGNGSEWTMYHLQNMGIGASVSKGWGVKTNAMVFVGSSGSIVYYNGISWTKQESGTTIDLRDVWGSADGKKVWASGESNDGSHSILLQYENNQWRTLWQRDGVTAVLPYGYNVGSVWNKNQTTFLSTSNGVFTLKDTVSAKMKNNFSEYSRNLRGNSEYDMLTTGEGGRMWHYNGVDWKLLLENQNYFIIGGNIKNNIAIAVGTDFSVGFGSGLIYFGKR